jgi:hypothetical protein
MAKKYFVVFFISCFFSTAVSMNALASSITVNHEQKSESIERVVFLLQNKLQAIHISDDLYIVKIKTQELLDDLSDVLKDGDPEEVQLLINGYISELSLIDAEALEPACAMPLYSGVFFAVISMGSTMISGDDPGCIVLNTVNSLADIISDSQDYGICVLEIPDPDDRDEEAIQKLKIEQAFVEAFDFATNALDVALCVEEPGFGDFFSVFMDFIGIFPSSAGN